MGTNCKGETTISEETRHLLHQVTLVVLSSSLLLVGSLRSLDITISITERGLQLSVYPIDIRESFERVTMSLHEQQGDRFREISPMTESNNTGLREESQIQVPAATATYTSASQSRSHRPSINSEGVTMDGLYAAVAGQERRRYSTMDDDSDIWDVPSDPYCHTGWEYVPTPASWHINQLFSLIQPWSIFQGHKSRVRPKSVGSDIISDLSAAYYCHQYICYNHKPLVYPKYDYCNQNACHARLFLVFRARFKSKGWKCLGHFETLAAAASKPVKKGETNYEEGEVNEIYAADDGQTRIPKFSSGTLQFELTGV
ncbi:predicted protein [Aspergillus nidulans FGSC A4]|uniref:Uncharacterized protein n=1 Tax=Emericella nidulans (strain FGSC A4 / ATCC 38163 / CBS 112.46 / NRRL 194 / M139) TaxID=227321 RepID=Q5BCJ0_EMENI|nr:hypothetical protein [Aspergillus nidulans FGSC A4]EAA64026.1 predicted protein [Aspergillus nidulans FGSC A4]CBF85475.1 TPA: conserved hypothetical protein [Aspergillus nidulans FGSC A4]|eukprot:XP_659344.1 predicted protein [Aspergillus nidulans FGSC A4]